MQNNTPNVDQQTAIDNLEQLCNHNPNNPLIAWLVDGVERWIRQPPSERQSLEHYLGLSAGRAGHVSAATLIQQRRRDGHLKAAAALIQQQHGVSTWRACGMLAERIRKFRTLRILTGEIDQRIAEAFDIGNELPTSQDRIFSIVILD